MRHLVRADPARQAGSVEGVWHEMSGPRRAEHEASRRRMGVTRKVASLLQVPAGRLRLPLPRGRRSCQGLRPAGHLRRSLQSVVPCLPHRPARPHTGDAAGLATSHPVLRLPGHRKLTHSCPPSSPAAFRHRPVSRSGRPQLILPGRAECEHGQVGGRTERARACLNGGRRADPAARWAAMAA
jgi:hypothetical protein